MRIKAPILFTIFCMLLNTAMAQSTTTPFSKYGVIQNVQNYSSNPFWSPNAPYNQRMPTAVYAMGPDVTTADCQTMVAYLVAAECGARNNCISSQLSDIRPAVMIQLSRMPNGNYATSCGGYIDTAFDQYVKQNAIAGPTAGASFPTTTDMPANNTDTEFQIENPYTPKLQDWQSDIMERKLELKNLQSANGVTTPNLERAAFPTTYADLSYSERLANEATGYQPFKGTSAYKPIEIESEEAYLTRQKELARLRDPEYCKTHPNDPNCKKKEENGTGTPQLSNSEKQKLIDRIIAAFPK